jgi:hypothetical protein
MSLKALSFNGHAISIPDIWVKRGPWHVETEFNDPIWTDQESVLPYLPSSEGCLEIKAMGLGSKDQRGSDYSAYVMLSSASAN